MIATPSHSCESLARFYWVVYLAPFRDLRVSKNDRFATCYHQVRDGMPIVNLLPALQHVGYEFGGPLLNFPQDSSLQNTRGALPAMSRNDLLALVTSPPMTLTEPERPARNRRGKPGKGRPRNRPVCRSFSREEQVVLEHLEREFLATCSRSCVTLVDALAQAIPAPLQNRKSIHFYRYKSGAYACEWKRDNMPENLDRMLTAGYLCYLPEIWPDGPRLLVVFGTSGVDTLTWTYLLGSRYASVLQNILASGERRFLFVEWQQVPLPKKRQFAAQGGDLAFLDAAREHVLLDLAAPARGAPQWSVRDCRSMGERREEFVTWKPARSPTLREPEPAL